MLLVAAAILLERRLVQVALLTWLVDATPHFIFHLGQTHHFSAGSNAEQLGVLGLVVLLFFAGGVSGVSSDRRVPKEC